VKRRIELSQIIATSSTISVPFEFNLSMDPQNDIYGIYAEYRIPKITWHLRDVSPFANSPDFIATNQPTQVQVGRIVTYYNGTTVTAEGSYQLAINVANAEIHYNGHASRTYSPTVWVQEEDDNFLAKRDVWIPTTENMVTHHGLFYLIEQPQIWIAGVAADWARVYYNYIEVEVELRGLLWSDG